MTAQVSDELWDEFHTVVNMSSRELQEWLDVQSAGPESEEVPDRAGPPAGRQVLRLLGKRRTDLTDEDAATMQRVVEVVRSQRGVSAGPQAGGAGWRHGLMNIGHDPLKPQ